MEEVYISSVEVMDFINRLKEKAKDNKEIMDIINQEELILQSYGTEALA